MVEKTIKLIHHLLTLHKEVEAKLNIILSSDGICQRNGKFVYNLVMFYINTCRLLPLMNVRGWTKTQLPLTVNFIWYHYIYSPWYHVASNVVSTMFLTFRNRFILTVSEHFTKWAEAIPLLSKCGQGVTESLFNVMIIV